LVSGYDKWKYLKAFFRKWQWIAIIAFAVVIAVIFAILTLIVNSSFNQLFSTGSIVTWSKLGLPFKVFTILFYFFIGMIPPAILMTVAMILVSIVRRSVEKGKQKEATK